jgi:multisubunit Na+/H+ antiporter MnhC subunit
MKFPATYRESAGINFVRRPLYRYMRDDEELRPLKEHPLTEDVSPLVFALVALTIVVISLAMLALLGMLP